MLIFIQNRTQNDMSQKAMCKLQTLFTLALSQTTWCIFSWSSWIWIRTTKLHYIPSVSYHFIWDCSRSKALLLITAGSSHQEWLGFTNVFYQGMYSIASFKYIELGANEARMLTKKHSHKRGKINIECIWVKIPCYFTDLWFFRIKLLAVFKGTHLQNYRSVFIAVQNKDTSRINLNDRH